MTESIGERPGALEAQKRRRRPSLLVLLPLLVFLGLAGVFMAQLVSGHDPQEIPSALIGASAPKTVLPQLSGATLADGSPAPGLDLADLGTPSRPTPVPVLVNVFASWCLPCRQEHPLLMGLSKDERFRLVGINYKDRPNNALGFLARLGNPYAAIGADEAGRSTIDWGVYGVPETFLVGTNGVILWKQTGPFTPESIANGLEPALAKALGAKS